MATQKKHANDDGAQTAHSTCAVCGTYIQRPYDTMAAVGLPFIESVVDLTLCSASCLYSAVLEVSPPTRPDIPKSVYERLSDDGTVVNEVELGSGMIIDQCVACSARISTLYSMAWSDVDTARRLVVCSSACAAAALPYVLNPDDCARVIGQLRRREASLTG